MLMYGGILAGGQCECREMLGRTRRTWTRCFDYQGGTHALELGVSGFMVIAHGGQTTEFCS